MNGYTEAEWAALAETIREDEEQRAAERWMCGELFTDTDYPLDPPPRRVRNVIPDLADYQPTTTRS